MSSRAPRAALLLAMATTLLAGIASAAGILFRGDLATIPYTTLRGESIEAVTTGIYAWNSLPVVSEGVGWDLVTLLLVVPAATVSIWLAARGSMRGQLVLAGLLAYDLYQYAEYAMFWAVGPLYPVHVLTLALAMSSLAMLAGAIDVRELAARFGPRFPRRGVTGIGVLMVVLLGGLWVPGVARVVLGGEVQGQLNGAQTLVVPAFDLGILVPLGVFTAVTAWQRRPVGFLLGSIVVVKAVAMPLAIVAMLLVEALATGTLALPPILVFAATAALAAAVGVRLFRALGAPVPADGPAGAAVTATSHAPAAPHTAPFDGAA